MWLILVIVAVSALYIYLQYAFAYWKRRGVPHLSTFRIPFGHITDLTDFRQLNSVLKPSYNHFCGPDAPPFIGLYLFRRPMVVIMQPDLIKQVLIKDFDCFHERGLYSNPRGDPLSAHLLSMDAEPWRHMRGKLTPTFTSGKMKYMFPTIMEVSDRFDRSLNELIGAGSRELDMKDLLGRFTTDIIGTCAFGIECNSLADPQAEFRRMGRAIFEKPRLNALGIAFVTSYKRLARWLNIKIISSDVSTFFLNVITETVKYREANNVRRNDFLDLMIELRRSDPSLSIEQMAAQAFIFFLAGFETSSTTMMFALFELASNPDIQTRARQEIKAVLTKHGGEYTYEAMMEMHYLNQVINETLRKYPPVTTLLRVAAKDYAVPDTTFVIPKDTQVLIPAYAIHHDDQYYESPERFDPDRFSADAAHSITFLPFGQGPRNCIGLRFGQLQTRVGLIKLLANYTIECGDRTPKQPLRFTKRSFLLNVDDGMWLKMTRIK